MEQVTSGWRRYALVQPPIMILIFAQAITSNIFTDLIVYRTCSVILNMNETECLLLHKNSSSAEALKIDAQAQPKASLIIMTKSIIESIIPALLSLFLGPWSDMYGRKSIMLAGYAGISMSSFILSFMTLWDINPWFMLIASLPYTCLGGFCVILLGSICYITDISHEQERGWQLAWMDALIFTGAVTGILAGPVIYQAYGYTAVFVCSTLCCILAGLYVCFLVPETIRNTDSGTVKSLFDTRLVKELFSTCTKERDGFNRYIVWCCILCITLRVIIMEGESTIGFLFASARLGWDVKKYSIYMAMNMIFAIVGIMFGVKLLVTYGGISEKVAVILSSLSSLCFSLVLSFTWKSWQMYLATALGIFGSVSNPMLRTILSKSVPPVDTGKIFSMTVSIETLTPLVAASLYSLIYSHFMPPLYPVPVWLLSVGINIIMILIVMSMKESSTIRHTPLIEDVNTLP
ncbi:uncharacterized protein LOC108623450 isoform X2 [Ceratina calcarata]|uniref:Uncharacterized protein LOC108623450 isoform X2 n=1 Tax=Ceratina calcarata TaxID=156304 RepID=A0AAJ7N4Q7_9HYME|nr:uncharacterized protein LOC108623450 isoform X2 [Ceratina calcarata]